MRKARMRPGIERLLALQSWGQSMDRAGDAFITAFAGADLKCNASACFRTLNLNYDLEVAGKPEPRTMTLEVRLSLAGGRLLEATLSGPALFSRLLEAHSAAPAEGDEAGRAAAIHWAAVFTAGAAERHLESSRCGGEARAPVALFRQCDGWTLELVGATSAEVEDRVVIRGPARL